MLDEVWREDVYRYSAQHVHRAETVLDIGANIGAFSLLAAALGANVAAIEPDPDNIMAILQNLDRNPDLEQRVAVSQVAAAAESGMAQFDTDPPTAGRLADTGDLTVRCLSLRDLVNQHGPISFLKVDIEGGEYSLFSPDSARDALSGIRRASIEFHNTHGPGAFGRLIEQLAEVGNTETIGAPSRGGMIYWSRY